MKSTYLWQQRIDCLTPKMVTNQILASVKNHTKQLYLPINIHILLALRRTPELQQRHSQNGVIFADGMPLIWLSRLTAHPLPARVSGTDLVETLLKDSRIKVFALGSTEPVLHNLKTRFPQLHAWYAPPFGSAWNEDEDKKIIGMINQSAADVILVGVGPLRQEQWLLAHFDRLKTQAGIAVGSAFDILSGEKPRAPRWMKDNGLEWLWRIILEPRRLSLRYLSDFLMLLYLIATQPLSDKVGDP